MSNAPRPLAGPKRKRATAPSPDFPSGQPPERLSQEEWNLLVAAYRQGEISIGLVKRLIAEAAQARAEEMRLLREAAGQAEPAEALEWRQSLNGSWRTERYDEAGRENFSVLIQQSERDGKWIGAGQVAGAIGTAQFQIDRQPSLADAQQFAARRLSWLRRALGPQEAQDGG